MSYSSTVLTDNPIRYYRLADSGTSAIDSGSQAQNGTLHGGITTGQTGLLVGDANTSMLFNGSTGYISSSSTGLPTGAAAWTMEAWVKLAATPSAYRIVMAFGTRATNQDASIYFDPTGKANVGFNAAGNVVGTTVSLNTPHYLAATYNGTTLTLYIDGVSVGTPATTTGAIVAGSATIGAEVDASSPFADTIDEGAWYSSALSATQISAHYTAGITASVVMNSIRYRPRVFGSTLVTKYIPRAFGGTIILGAPTFIATEALTISDSAIFTSTSVLIDANTANDTSLSTGIVLPIDANTVTENMLSTDTYLPIEANTASDIGNTFRLYLPIDALTATGISLATDTALPIDGLSANDSLLSTDISLPINGNTASDIGGGALSRWPLDALTVTDTSLSTETLLPLDALSASDRLLGSASFIPVEAGIVSESVLATRTVMSIEANTLSESMTGADVYIPTETLSLTESLLDTDSASFTDANTLSESLSSTLAFMPTDALTVLDVVLDTDIFLPIEVDAITDSSTVVSSPVGGITTNTMTFEDDLVVSDAFLAQRTYIPVDATTGSSSLLAQMATIPVDALSIIDSLLDTVAYLPLDTVPISDVTGSTLARWGIDALIISDSFAGNGVAVPTEVLSVVDVLLVLESVSFSDALSLADLFTGVMDIIIFGADVTWMTRDGLVTWNTRDGKVTWKTRDENAAWKTRDEQASWNTRDELVTWKTK